jgi:two-component system, NtrC family, response regulator HydG
MFRRILVVDDDARIRASLLRALAPQATDVRVADTAESALAALAASRPDVLLTDMRMPGMNGLELLRLVRERAPGVDVVMMTAFDDLPTIAAAMRAGAADFLVKPLDLGQLRDVLERVFRDRDARAHSDTARSAAAASDGAVADAAAGGTAAMVGRDARMIQIFKVIGQAAAVHANVMIRGESGTGKELIARAIHEASAAADEPFVAVNCTALPSTLLESELFGHVRGAFTGASADRRGRFALAAGGTIFLDEIGDTTAEFQGKLLRVLQEREYYPVGADRPERTSARVIAATHRDLEALVAAGTFRQDLYYRLRVVEITVPPLRARPTDIPLLARHLVRKAAAAAGREPPLLSTDASEALLVHDWPGNVRELENCLLRAVVLATGDVIRAEHLAIVPQTGTAPPRMTTLVRVEREHVLSVLQATGGHKARAARVLGVSRPRLDRLLRKHGIEARPAPTTPSATAFGPPYDPAIDTG